MISAALPLSSSVPLSLAVVLPSSSAVLPRLDPVQPGPVHQGQPPHPGSQVDPGSPPLAGVQIPGAVPIPGAVQRRAVAQIPWAVQRRPVAQTRPADVRFAVSVVSVVLLGSSYQPLQCHQG